MVNKLQAVIFANGEIYDYSFADKYINKDSLIVCCDGGVRHTFNLSILPDFIIGDFDSADESTLNYYRDKKIPLLPYPPEKDYTDLELSLNFVMEKNPDSIVIFGGIGSRLDHTLANIQLLSLPLSKNIPAILVNENNTIQLMDKEISLRGSKGELVSLVPIGGDVKGVTTENLFYPLKNETLHIGSSRGVSNVFNGETARVSIASGLLAVIRSLEI